MGMWAEWRGPRSGWSRRTKVVAWLVTILGVVAWIVFTDNADEWFDSAPPPSSSVSR